MTGGRAVVVVGVARRRPAPCSVKTGGWRIPHASLTGEWREVAVDDRSDEAAYPWRTQGLSPMKRKVVPIQREAASPWRDRQHRVPAAEVENPSSPM